MIPLLSTSAFSCRTLEAYFHRAADLAALMGGLLLAIGTAPVPAAELTPVDEFVETRHQVDVGDRAIEYTARAGLLPLYENDTGELMARMFVVAYVADGQRDGPARPVTFIWNGGPGASSSQVHLVGFGPKGFETPATFPDWIENPPDRIGDRAETWLTESDLVFVDPIGTGYSRATSTEYRDLLYTTRGDIEAVAEAIRLYRTRFDAWDQPLIIAGESYGTTRAMGVAEALERRRAGIAGVILISGWYEAGQEMTAELDQALEIPKYAAAAHYHRRLPPDLQQLPQAEAMAAAEAWARSEYAPALARRDALTAEEREAILAGVERHTGVAKQFVNADSLLLEGTTFTDRLLDEQELELGHYDLRMTFPRRDLSRSWAPLEDPSLKPMLDLMQGTSVPMIRYIRNTLGYRSDLLYRGPFGEAFHPRPLEDVTGGVFGTIDGIYSDWMAVMWNQGEFAKSPAAEEAAETPSEAEAETEAEPTTGAEATTASPAQPRPERPPLEQAMLRNPDFLVWNIRGLYDQSCAALDEALARTDEPLRHRVRNGCYAGGHMLYTEPQVRRQLQADFADFVADAVAAQRHE